MHKLIAGVEVPSWVTFITLDGDGNYVGWELEPSDAVEKMISNKMISNKRFNISLALLKGANLMVTSYPQLRQFEEITQDNVNDPKHYEGVKGLYVREVQENFVPKYEEWGPLVASDLKDTIKYVLRAPDKNGLEDLKKARKTLNYAIDALELRLNEPPVWDDVEEE